MLFASDSGRIQPAQQRARSMRSMYQHDNANSRMTAMRNRNLLGFRRWADSCLTLRTEFADFLPRVLWQNESEMPALRVGYQEVAKDLDARDRFEFLGINKKGIERERVGFAEQLH